ncbi:MAG: ribonuclease R [Thermodesulfovibrionales bacterium]|nr:ribonuclease R [Thermodesulfovibrionales bacterium]
MIDKDTILALFLQKKARPLNFKEIISHLVLGHKEARAAKRILRTLLISGDLVMTRKGFYGPSDDMNLIRGLFESHRDGYGFVIMEKPGERDIFIPSWGTSGAMGNDRVLVRVENWKKREGRVVRILERAQKKIAGRLEAAKSGFSVRPKDKALPYDIQVTSQDRGDAKIGDTVIVEISEYPSDRKPASGRILKTLGKPENPRAEVEMIIDEFNLPKKFPRSVLEATVIVARHRPEDRGPGIEGRKDFRDLPTVTIDGERAKDFDDAVSVRITKHGYTLSVHIADVGFYVNWNSAIDREASARGTSFYFPEKVIPMLPKELSEDLCSLKPGVDRFAVTVEMDFDRNGGRLDARFYPSIIRSDERMTYTSVSKILIDADRTERKKHEHLLHDFEVMGELCGLLRNKRLQRGSLDFDLPEPEILLDIQGVPEAILKAERNYAHTIIEEFMIAANEAVAEHLEHLNIPVLYRVHEEPDPHKLEEISKMSGTLMKGRKFLKPKDYPDLLKKIKGSREEEIINFALLRSLKQARYSNLNVGHFGLASQCYTHFTSPIRRYPDLIVHRVLREVLQKKRISDTRREELNKLLPDIAFHSSRMERLADKAEREVIDAMRVWFMKDKVGEEFEAKVAGVTPYGLKIRLRDFFVEGFLHVSYMTDDYYQYNEQSMKLVGRHGKRSFSIGQEIRVRLDRVDREEREIILDICKDRKISRSR